MHGVAILVVMLVATAARADDPLSEARTAYYAQDQERSLALLAPMLAGSALPEHPRAAGFRLAGCAHMVLGERTAAIDSFRKSFALEPDASLEPSLASPDARSLYEIARGEWRAELVAQMEAHATDIARLKVDVVTPPRAVGGTQIPIRVTVEDPGHLATRVDLGFRRRGTPVFTMYGERLLQPTTQFLIPSDVTESARGFVLEYHVTVRHPTGFDLRRVGDPDHPRTLAVAAGHRRRWHESWLVRGSIVVAIVGLGTAGYLLYRSIDVGPQDVTVVGR